MSRYSYELLDIIKKCSLEERKETAEKSEKLEKIFPHSDHKSIRNIPVGLYKLIKCEDLGEDEYGGKIFILHLGCGFYNVMKVRIDQQLAQAIKEYSPQYINKTTLSP